MKRTWTILGVRDVSASVAWYQALFGQTETPPAHDDFGQILERTMEFSLRDPDGYYVTMSSLSPG